MPGRGHLPDAPRRERDSKLREVADEVVVGLHAGVRERLVLDEHEVDHGALGREEDGRADTVLVHQLETALRLEDAGCISSYFTPVHLSVRGVWFIAETRPRDSTFPPSSQASPPSSSFTSFGALS